MNKILLSLIVVGLVASVAVGATRAYYSDVETSNSNTLAAGTLDLNIDGGNTNVVKFNLTNLRPGNQPTGRYTLKNVGSVDGYFDLHNITVTSEENGCLDPETEAGDTTCGSPNQGELPDRLGLTMYVDYNCDGYYSAGDRYIYNAMARSIASDYDFNEPLTAGASKCVQTVFNWWAGATDNLAQGDSMALGMTFELGQTTSQ